MFTVIYWESQDKQSEVTCHAYTHNEGRNQYWWRISWDGGRQTVSSFDEGQGHINSGVGDGVDALGAIGTLGSFVSAWMEANQNPSSENYTIFPQEMVAWADKYGDEFYMDTMEREQAS